MSKKRKYSDVASDIKALTPHIPMDECIDGHVYYLDSRNLGIGVYRTETKGFTGIRTKFEDRYLFEEYHWETGPPCGTANALAHIGPLPFERDAVKDKCLSYDGPLFDYLDSLKLEEILPKELFALIMERLEFFND